MTETEPMSVNERRKYLHKMRIRYWQPKDKSAKSALLNEMQTVTNLHRKSLIRLIKGELARKPRRQQRGKTYGAEVQSVVEKIAHSLDYPCAERLQPNLVWMAKHLEAHGEIELNPDLQTKLTRISISSVRRLLPPSQRAAKRIAHSKRQAPGRSYAQRQAIPMRRIPWQEKTPGHFEVDLVHHCGPSASGQYVHTLQMTDVAIGFHAGGVALSVQRGNVDFFFEIPRIGENFPDYMLIVNGVRKSVTDRVGTRAFESLLKRATAIKGSIYMQVLNGFLWMKAVNEENKSMDSFPVEAKGESVVMRSS